MTADASLTQSSVPEPDLRQRTTAAGQDEVASVDETRPRLRSRRDGRMSAAGRLAEQAAEAAAAAGWAADGTLLVVRARWRNKRYVGHSILCWTCAIRSLSIQVADVPAYTIVETSRLGLSQADGRGAIVSLAKPHTDANTDSSTLAAPAEAPFQIVAAEGSRQDASIGRLTSSSTSSTTSHAAGAAAQHRPLDVDGRSALRMRSAGAGMQLAARPGMATMAGQQGPRRAGVGLQQIQSLPQAGADASTTWQAELASALRGAHMKTTSRVAQDERRLAQTALALLPTAVSDNPDE